MLNRMEDKEFDWKSWTENIEITREERKMIEVYAKEKNLLVRI